MNNNYHFYLDKNYVLPLIYLLFSVIISHLFIGGDRNVNLIYYMIMFLLYLSIYNIKSSFDYYVKLRNYKGLRGDRGDPGAIGSPGVDGTCIMSKGCGLLNCRKLILDELLKKYPDLEPINNKVESNIMLNPSEKRKYDMISNYIDILLPQCNEYDDGVDEFRKLIAKTLK